MTDSGNVRALTPPVKPTRRERAQATRSRILDAAHELFVEQGYAGTRMVDVAAGAGVAVQTVYFTFHTKGELLDACMARAVMGPDDPLPPDEQPFWLAMMAAGTGAEAVRRFVEGVATIEARVGRLNQVVSSATHDPDAARIWARSEELRRSGFREAVEHIAARFGLREGLDVDRATDVLLTICGHTVYCSLVHDCGWPQDSFAEWLADTVCEMLLESEGSELLG